MRALAVAGALLGLAIAAPAAASVACRGVVTNIAIEPDSAVWVSYGHGMHRLCFLNSNHNVNIGAAWTAITPETCKSLYSSFTTAKATGRQVSAIYERTDCNIGNWVDPNPYPALWEFPQ